MGSEKAESVKDGEREDEGAHVGGITRRRREDDSELREEREEPSDTQEPGAAGVLLCICMY